MRLVRVLALVLFCAVPVLAQNGSIGTEDTRIRAVLVKQASDWNSGDLTAFATGYKDSPEIVFMGKTIHRGYAEMLAGYREQYPTRKKMGALSFTNLDVHQLDDHYATVLGNFHLQRNVEDGGDADGYFSLVLEKTFTGWKIILDHTTNTTAK